MLSIILDSKGSPGSNMGLAVFGENIWSIVVLSVEGRPL